MDVLGLAEQLWQGEATVEEHNPLFPAQEMAEVGDGIAFVASLANVSAFATDDGLVLVDTGSPFMAGAIHGQLRSWTELPSVGWSTTSFGGSKAFPPMRATQSSTRSRR